MTEAELRTRLLDDLIRCEAALADHPAWAAWSALEARIALGRGPDATQLGRLVGAYAAELAADPRFAALLDVRSRLRTLGGGAVVPQSSSNAAVRLIPAEPARRARRERPPIDASWQPAAHPKPEMAALVSAGAGSLLDRIARLEQDAVALDTSQADDDARPTYAEEAEVEIFVAPVVPGLMARLGALPDDPTPVGARPSPVALEAEVVEIVVLPDADEDA